MASGDTLLVIDPRGQEPPAANYARMDTRNSHWVLDFAEGEIAVFSSILPQHYSGGGISVIMDYAMTSATTDKIRLDSELENIGIQGQNIDSDGFAAAVQGSEKIIAWASGLVDQVQNDHANGSPTDNLLRGDPFRMRITRIGGLINDAVGDLELLKVELREI